MTDRRHTINLLIAALGGEGGGVLTNWLIEAADRSGWQAQSTSLAGVAQRTGATIYYLEFFQRQADAPAPVMSLFPAQGDIDIAVTSEIAEAGRMLSRGFISPDKTTLISSDHRIYGITEKSATTDGTADPLLITELCGRYAQRFIHFDMLEVVERCGTVISAALLGAIAGAKVLPFSKELLVEIMASGKGADANLKAFEECYQAAIGGGAKPVEPAPGFVLGSPTTTVGRVLMPRISSFPISCHEVLYYAVQRLVAYQDSGYAGDYLTQLEQLCAHDDGADNYHLTRETARWLALWLAYEDIPRVAQLKLRPAREASIRAEVRADIDQPMQVTEFFHPRVEEVAALLPKQLGQRLLGSATARRALGILLGPRKLRTDTIHVQLVLRGLASLRRWRRSTYGYAEERAMIDRWFEAVFTQSQSHSATARALADCGRMVKGYGATRQRTTSRLMAIVDAVESGVAFDADAVRRLHDAAMQGEESAPFEQTVAALAEHDLSPLA